MMPPPTMRRLRRRRGSPRAARYCRELLAGKLVAHDAEGEREDPPAAPWSVRPTTTSASELATARAACRHQDHERPQQHPLFAYMCRGAQDRGSTDAASRYAVRITSHRSRRVQVVLERRQRGITAMSRRRRAIRAPDRKRHVGETLSVFALIWWGRSGRTRRRGPVYAGDGGADRIIHVQCCPLMCADEQRRRRARRGRISRRCADERLQRILVAYDGSDDSQERLSSHLADP